MALPTFTIDSSSRVSEYPPSGQRKIIVGNLVVDGTVGVTPGDIPASVFGLTFLEESRPLVKNDNTLLVSSSPAFDGKSLLGKAAATAAPAAIPAGTYRAVVFGY